ncbi:Uncharacterised protein [uncultured archaeon]|nr:Uncharacterised protein [uncultured archaeon]
MELTTIRGNFIGATIVCIINLILVDIGVFRKISRTQLLLINIVLDFLIILFMGLAFR